MLMEGRIADKLLLTHETSWEIGVGTYFTIDFDQTLHDNFGHFGVSLRPENDEEEINIFLQFQND